MIIKIQNSILSLYAKTKNFFQCYPILLPLLSLIVGAFFIKNFSYVLFILKIFIIFLPQYFCFLLLLVFYNKKTYYKFLLKTILYFLLFLWGNFYVHQKLNSPLPKITQTWVQSSQVVQVRFEAKDYCRKTGNTYAFRAELIDYFEGETFVPLSLGLELRVKHGKCSVQPGEIYRSLLKFYQPRRYQNPSSFDYPFYLKTQGVDLTAYALSEKFLVLEKTQDSSLKKLSYHLRQNIHNFLEESFQDSPQVKGLLHALLLRNKGELFLATKESFHRVGLAHLLVVSGLHLAWVFMFFYLPIYFILNFIQGLANRSSARLLASLLALIPIYFYVEIIGLGPPVLRAALMIFLGAILWGMRLRRDFFAIIFLCAFLLLFFHPIYVWDISFQFSFLSLIGLYISGRYFHRQFKEHPFFQKKFFHKMIFYILTSLYSCSVLNVFLLPLTAHYFHSYSLIAPLANLLVLPLFIFLLMPLLFCSVLLSLFDLSINYFFVTLLKTFANFFLVLVEKLAQFNFAHWKIASLSLSSYLIILILIFAIFHVHQRKTFFLSMLLMCLLLSVQVFWQRYLSSDSALKLVMIDVGQGESLLLQLPNQKNILIDGGGPAYGDFDLGERVLVPELMRLGVKKLDAIYLTHADSDHYRGLDAVLKNFPVRQFCRSIELKNYPELTGLAEILNAKAIEPCQIYAKQSWQEGPVSFEVLWPTQEYLNSPLVKDNATSLVMKICYQEHCFLLTGDIEADVEEYLLAQNIDLKSTILKLAHHGSKSSSIAQFLNKTSPRLALVSSGAQNRFGHPHRQVLKRLQKNKIPLLRTDRDGQIEIIFKNQKIFYQTFSGKKGELE